ncbi:hypothetical protein [Pseudomonas proteolytica]|uniref:hypothetical protein n=1 Tax=Pseudomonas proteolytica TaxID=219574 RepID=UPI0032082DCE
MSIIFEHTQKNYENNETIEIGNPHRTICRFCKGKEKPYRKKAHSAPEFLGNKTIFTLDECDNCNSFFGEKIEPELKKFIGPSFLHNLKGKKGWPTSEAKGNIKLRSGNEHRIIDIVMSENFTPKEHEILIKGEQFSCLKVYKGLLKILLSILPDEYFPEFESTFKWLMSGRDFMDLNHAPCAIVGRQAPDFRLENLMELSLVRDQLNEGAVYQMTAAFNSIKITLPFSPILKIKLKMGEGIDEPIEYKKIHFEFIDFSNSYTRSDFKLFLDLSNVPQP